MDLFSNYSFETSLPAYKESGKEIQAERIRELISKGVNNLLRLSEVTNLPQSTVAGRVNDLIKESVVEYNGLVVYKDRKRKRITIKKTAA